MYLQLVTKKFYTSAKMLMSTYNENDLKQYPLFLIKIERLLRKDAEKKMLSFLNKQKCFYYKHTNIN